MRLGEQSHQSGVLADPPDPLLVELDRVVVPARLDVGGPQEPGNDDEVRIHRHDPLVALHRLLVLAQEVVGPTQADRHREGERIQVVRSLQRFVGLLQAPHRHQVLAVPVMHRRVAGVQLDGALELRLGSRKVPLVDELGVSPRRAGLGHARLQLEGLPGGLLDPLVGFIGRQVSVPAQQAVGIRQTRVGEGVVRIEGDGLLEALDARSEAVGPPTVAQKPALQIKLVRLHHVGVAANERWSRLTGLPYELGAQMFDDLAGDLLLNREDVGHFAIVALSPDLESVTDIDQLDRDPHAIIAHPHAALQHRAHVQEVADLAHVLGGILELE